MIFADSYFCIGKQHANEGKPCQDYATTQVGEDGAIAIISDGCSTGGKTDLGSRFISCASLLSIQEYKEAKPYDIRQRILGLSRLAGANDNDLLATLGIVCHKNGITRSYLFGDGVIAKKNNFGDLIAIKYEWKSGMPYYLAYNLEDFISQACNGSWQSPSCTKEVWHFDYLDNEWIKKVDIELSALTGVNGFESLHDDIGGSLQENDSFIAVFSDGITQIKDVDWKDVVFEFMNYKSTSGEFVKRRMMKALKTMTPMDDIACSVLRITSNADNETDTVNT